MGLNATGLVLSGQDLGWLLSGNNFRIGNRYRETIAQWITDPCSKVWQGFHTNSLRVSLRLSK